MAMTELQSLQFKSAVKLGIIKELYKAGAITKEQFSQLMKLNYIAA